jgi:hypothetical protein
MIGMATYAGIGLNVIRALEFDRLLDLMIYFRNYTDPANHEEDDETY